MEGRNIATRMQMEANCDVEMGTDEDGRRRRWVEFFDREKYKQYVMLMRSRQFSETVELLKKWYRECDPFKPPVELPVPTLELTATPECDDAERSQSDKSSDSQISALSGISYTTNGSAVSSFVSVKSEVKKKNKTVAIAVCLVLLLVVMSIALGVVLHLYLDKDFFRSKPQNTNNFKSNDSISSTVTLLPVTTLSHSMVPQLSNSSSQTTDMSSPPSNPQESSPVTPNVKLPGHTASSIDDTIMTSASNSSAVNVTSLKAPTFEQISRVVNATDVISVTDSQTAQLTTTPSHVNGLTLTPNVLRQTPSFTETPGRHPVVNNTTSTRDEFLNKSHSSGDLASDIEATSAGRSGDQRGHLGVSTAGPTWSFADPLPTSFLKLTSSFVTVLASSVTQTSSTFEISSSSSQTPASSLPPSSLPSLSLSFLSSQTPSSLWPSSSLNSSPSQTPSTSPKIQSLSSTIPSSSSKIPSLSEIASLSPQMPASSSQIPASLSKIPASSLKMSSSLSQMPFMSSIVPFKTSEIPSSNSQISPFLKTTLFSTNDREMFALQTDTPMSSSPSPLSVNVSATENPMSIQPFTNLFEHLHLSLTSSTHKYSDSIQINPSNMRLNDSSETSLGFDPALSDTGSLMNDIFNPAGAVNTFQTLTDSISSNPAPKPLGETPLKDPNAINIEHLSYSDQNNISKESTSRFELLTLNKFTPSDVTTEHIGSTASQRRVSTATTTGKDEDLVDKFLSLSQTSEEHRFSENSSGKSSISFTGSTRKTTNDNNETSTVDIDEHLLSETTVKFDFSLFSEARNKSVWTGGDGSSAIPLHRKSHTPQKPQSSPATHQTTPADLSRISGPVSQGRSTQSSRTPQPSQSSASVVLNPRSLTDRASGFGTRPTSGLFVKTTTAKSAIRPVAAVSTSPFKKMMRKLITTSTTTMMSPIINKQRELEQLNAVYGNSNSPDGLSFGGSNSGPPGEVGGHAVTDYDSIIRDMPPPEVLPFAIASKVAVTPPVLTTRPPPRTQKPPKIVLITHDIVAEIGMTISGNLKVGCTAKEAWGWTYMAISRYEGENSFTLEFLGGIERRDEWPFIPIDSRMSDFTLHRDDEMVNLVLETKYAMCEDKGRYICEVNVNKTFFSKTFNVDIKKKPDKPILTFPDEVFAGDNVTIVTTWDAGNPLIGHIVHDIVEGFTGLLFAAKNERTISWYKDCAIMVENRYSVTPDLSWNETLIIARIEPETGASLLERSIVERVKADRKKLIVLDRKMCEDKLGQRLPNPYNAHKYISCSFDGPKVEPCPEGHIFNVTKKICVLIPAKREGGNV